MEEIICKVVRAIILMKIKKILMKSLLVNMEFHLKKKVKEPWWDRGIRRS